MTDPASPSGETAFTPLYRHMVLALLLLAYILSFIDRNIMAVLVTPIQQDLQITDSQFALLHGFAFAVFYTLLGLPIARWADRGSRVKVISIGVIFWSIMTSLCGVAKQFPTLFLARMGVGLGEAALSPASHSLLSDMYPRKQLPMAMAVYTLGITIGGGLAYTIGGQVYGFFSAREALVLPLVGHVAAWQVTFLLLGLPGVVLGVLLAMIHEPARTGQVLSRNEVVPLSQAWAFAREHWRLYLPGFAGISMLSILGYGVLTWLVAFLQRSYGMPLQEAASVFGAIYVLAGSAGTLSGGWYANWLQRRHEDASLRMVVHVALLAILPAVAAPLMPNAVASLCLFAPLVFLLSAYFGVSIAAFQSVTPNDMRAQVSAVLLFVTNLAGLALGPAMVAALTDFVFAEQAALRYSLAILGAIMAPLAALLLWLSLPAYRQRWHAITG
ncbi:MAG: MFS transporter [Gammaproteobacteria bacterium]|nr:MAG: MFS transporter [Gammaproteobacteria bacterium]